MDMAFKDVKIFHIALIPTFSMVLYYVHFLLERCEFRDEFLVAISWAKHNEVWKDLCDVEERNKNKKSLKAIYEWTTKWFQDFN